MTPARPPPAGPRQLPIVTAATFAAFLDVFALLPIIAPAAAARGAGDVGIGVTVAAYSATGLVGNVAGGWLADRYGRRRTAAAGLVVAAAALVGYPATATLAGLVAARLVHGLGGGVAMPALFAAAGDAAGPGHRGVAMGRLGATIGVAAVVAPATAGLVAAAAGAQVVFVAVAVALAGAAVLAARLPDAPTANGPAVPDDGAARGDAATRRQAPARARLAAAVAVFGFTASLGALTGFLPATLAARGAGEAAAGLLLTGFAVVAVAIMLSPAMRRLDAGTLAGPLGAGTGVIALAVATLAADAGVAGAAAAVIVVGCGFGAVFPAAATATAAAPGGRRGRAFGRFHAAYGLGFVVGPPGSAALGAALGVSPFAPAAAACGLCALGAWRLAATS